MRLATLVLLAIVSAACLGGVAMARAIQQREAPPISNGRFQRDTWQGPHSECWFMAFVDFRGEVKSWQLSCVPLVRALSSHPGDPAQAGS